MSSLLGGWPIEGLLIAVCMAAFLLAVRGGIGLTNDSRGYLLAAERVAAGQGLTIVNGDGDPIPLTQFAPLYALVLALLLAVAPATGLDVRQFAVGVNGVALLTILFSVRSILNSADGSRAGRTAALAFAALGVGLIGVCGMALSDGLFLAGVAATYAAYRRFAASGSLVAAVGVAAGMTVAVLTRYAGIALLASVGVSLALAARRTPATARDRVRRPAVAAAIMLGPPTLALAGVFLRNRLVGELTGRRTFDFHPPGWESLGQFVEALVVWSVGPFHRGSLVAGVAAALVVLGYRWRGPRVVADETPSRTTPSIRADLGVFAAVYPLFIVGSYTFIDGYIPFDERILAPLYLAAVCLAPAALAAAGRRFGPAWGMLVPAVVAFGLGCQAFNAIAWVREAPDYHMGYASSIWRNSPTMAALKRLPKRAKLYANSPAAVYLCVGRFAKTVPNVFDATTHKPATGYLQELNKMRDDLAVNDGYVVYVKMVSRPTVVPAEKLRADLPMETYRRFADGAIYRMPH